MEKRKEGEEEEEKEDEKEEEEEEAEGEITKATEGVGGSGINESKRVPLTSDIPFPMGSGTPNIPTFMVHPSSKASGLKN